mmetsp:Transcript_57928/g.162479  ORF Transcript_57928/g.162479 Transcript_57928/m.162479 type:complete len:378 (+) Transcript_57928:767-1900(+)
MLGGRLLRDLALQERGDALHRRASAADACEAHDVHDLVAELDVHRPLPAAELLVHVLEHVLHLVLLHDADGLLAQLLHLVDADVEEEALHQARQNEPEGECAPTCQVVSIRLLDPLAEEHVEDALGDAPLEAALVAQIDDLRLGPLLRQEARKLPHPRLVGAQTRVQHELVQDVADHLPLALGVRQVGQKDEDAAGEEVRGAGGNAAEGRLPGLLGHEDLRAHVVRPAPDALAVPPIVCRPESSVLPHEQGEPALAVGDEGGQAGDGVAPPRPGHVQGVPGEDGPHQAAAGPGARDAAGADGDDDVGALAKPGDDALHQRQGEGEPHEDHRYPGGVPRDLDQRGVHDIGDAAPILPGRVFGERLRVRHRHFGRSNAR